MLVVACTARIFTGAAYRRGDRAGDADRDTLKEVQVFALINNLVRQVMLLASARQEVDVRRISFVDALRWLQTAEPGDPLVPLVVNPHRPNRLEPRVRNAVPKNMR